MPDTEHSRRIVFMGTPEFARTGLEALLASGQRPVAVYTQPDRPAGRGRKLTPSPVKSCALDAGIPVRQPESLKSADARNQLAELRPDVIVVIAYGLLLPRAVLDIPALGCINVHASLLPRWRGAAPIQRAIEAGDRETGVCLMRMEAGLDTGPVLARSTCVITPEMTAGELHDRLAELGGHLLTDHLPTLETCLAQAVPQADDQATYAPKLSKEDARLDLGLPASTLARKIRAFNPWPVAWLMLNGEPVRIWDAASTSEAATGPARPGIVRVPDRRNLLVGTSDGWLSVHRLQPRGKKPLAVRDWLNGLSPDAVAGLQAR